MVRHKGELLEMSLDKSQELPSVIEHHFCRAAECISSTEALSVSRAHLGIAGPLTAIKANKQFSRIF